MRRAPLLGCRKDRTRDAKSDGRADSLGRQPTFHHGTAQLNPARLVHSQQRMQFGIATQFPAAALTPTRLRDSRKLSCLC